MKSARRLLALALALAACGLVLLVTGLRGPSQRAALLSASRGNSLAPAPPPRLGSGLDGILSESEDAHSLADAKVLLKKRAGNSLASLDTFFDASGQERPFVPETTITGFCGTWRDTKMSSTEGVQKQNFLDCTVQDCKLSLNDQIGCRYLDEDRFCYNTAIAQEWCRDNPKDPVCADDAGEDWGWASAKMGTAEGDVTAWIPKTNVALYDYTTMLQSGEAMFCACLKNCACEFSSYKPSDSKCRCMNGQAETPVGDSSVEMPRILSSKSSGSRGKCSCLCSTGTAILVPEAAADTTAAVAAPEETPATSTSDETPSVSSSDATSGDATSGDATSGDATASDTTTDVTSGDSASDVTASDTTSDVKSGDSASDATSADTAVEKITDEVKVADDGTDVSLPVDDKISDPADDSLPAAIAGIDEEKKPAVKGIVPKAGEPCPADTPCFPPPPPGDENFCVHDCHSCRDGMSGDGVPCSGGWVFVSGEYKPKSMNFNTDSTTRITGNPADMASVFNFWNERGTDGGYEGGYVGPIPPTK